MTKEQRSFLGSAMSLITAVSAALSTSDTAQAQMSDAWYQSVAPSVVQVGVQRASGRLAIGSAVIVAPGKLVTACHGSRDAVRVFVMRGAEQLEVSVGAQDLEHDLCLLNAPMVSGPVAQRASTRSLRVGAPIAALGYSTGFRLSLGEGEVKALYPHDGALVVRGSAWFTTGASGGGLFDAAGRLVGVLSFKSTAGNEHHYAMPIDWLDRLLEQASAPVPAAQARYAFWEREENLQPFFLRAAWLEGSFAWQELAVLAQAWTAQETDNAEAWLALGRAYLELEQLTLARSALKKAVALESKHRDVLSLLARTNTQADRAPTRRMVTGP